MTAAPVRIPSGTAILMIVVAAGFDFMQGFVAAVIPVIGLVLAGGVDVAAALCFGLWFGHYGFSLMRRKPLGFLSTIVMEFIPLIGLFPTWVFFVALTLAAARASEPGV